MKLTINQKDFYHGVQIVQRAVASRSTLPILKGIYLEAIKDKGLKLIANNLEMGIEYWVEANIIEEEFLSCQLLNYPIFSGNYRQQRFPSSWMKAIIRLK